MARFNTTKHQSTPAVALATSPIATVTTKPDTRTFEGAAGWTRTAQAELFLRATGAFHGGEGTFYESADKRDDRLRELVAQVVRQDYAWLVDFATWLRGPGNMRTASLMIAVEAVHEDLAWLREATSNLGSTSTPYTNDGFNRQIINAVCQRADEPGELLAIWTAWYGRKIPKPVKRGVADAVQRLYNEYALLKYDTASKGYRFGDVLNLVHASPDAAKPWQGELFRHALDRRHNPTDAVVPESLKKVHSNVLLRGQAAVGDFSQLVDPEALRGAGMTWEDVLSLSGQAGDKIGWSKKALWEALIPTMGIMALLRNLRNFDQAGVSDKVAQQVVVKLTDPEVIAKSRQFPFRFLSAHKATANSLRWAYPLEQALSHSLANVPSLGGRTLILVDMSGSMFYAKMSERSELSRAEGASIFGAALALRAEDATLVQFGSTSSEIPFNKGDAVLAMMKRFGSLGGTNTATATRQHYKGHDRVIIITDEQAHDGDPGAQVPAHIPVYTWNLQGYTAGYGPSGSSARFTLGGLTDRAFTLIPMLESGVSGVWPWQVVPVD